MNIKSKAKKNNKNQEVISPTLKTNANEIHSELIENGNLHKCNDEDYLNSSHKAKSFDKINSSINQNNHSDESNILINENSISSPSSHHPVDSHKFNLKNESHKNIPYIQDKHATESNINSQCHYQNYQNVSNQYNYPNDYNINQESSPLDHNYSIHHQNTKSRSLKYSPHSHLFNQQIHKNPCYYDCPPSSRQPKKNNVYHPPPFQCFNNYNHNQIHNHYNNNNEYDDDNDDDELSDVMISWYNSGYHTGYYKAIQDMKRLNKNLHRHNHNHQQHHNRHNHNYQQHYN